MRTLVHLSDLHFGRVHPLILDPLVAFVDETKPDVVAISGDFTQRARTVEYIAAREFLERIPFPKIVVPGNHDVPLRNLFLRFFRSLDSYRRYICDDLEPFFADDEVAIAGVNTARALTWKDGRINRFQLARLRERFRALTGGPNAYRRDASSVRSPGRYARECRGPLAPRDDHARPVPDRHAARRPFPHCRRQPYREALQHAGILGADRFVGHEHVRRANAAARRIRST